MSEVEWLRIEEKVGGVEGPCLRAVMNGEVGAKVEGGLGLTSVTSIRSP